jgi:hypothetical protein
MKKFVLALFSILICFSYVQAQEEEYAPLQQGAVSFKVGYFMPRGESDIWTENAETFTLEVDDFNGFAGGIELSWFLNQYITVAGGVDFYRKTVDTEYRDFLGDDGQPIFQNFKLTVVPVTATVKFTPLGNGSPSYSGEKDTPFVPWVGGGIGVYSYQYEEDGEFIDDSDDSIFRGNFLSENEVGFGAHVAGGIIVPIGLKFDVFGEVKYAWVDADLSDEFSGFEPIDLGGISYFFGGSYRF